MLVVFSMMQHNHQQYGGTETADVDDEERRRRPGRSVTGCRTCRSKSM